MLRCTTVSPATKAALNGGDPGTGGKMKLTPSVSPVSALVLTIAPAAHNLWRVARWKSAAADAEANRNASAPKYSSFAVNPTPSATRKPSAAIFALQGAG